MSRTYIPRSSVTVNGGTRRTTSHLVNGSSTTTINSSIPSTRTVIERQTVNTPNFKRMHKKKGESVLPHNPFYFYKRVEILSHGVQTQVMKTPGINPLNAVSHSLVGSFAGTSSEVSTTVFSAFTPAEKESIDGEVRNKIRLKMKDQKVNIGNIIGERKQTIDMVAGVATKLFNAARNVKRGNFREAAHALGIQLSNRKHKTLRTMYKKDQSLAVANGWLQLQYGWLPLLSDVHDGAEALASAIHDDLKVRSTAIITRNSNIPKSEVLGGSQPYLRRTVVSSMLLVRYDVYYTVDLKSSHLLANAGLTNPVGIAWELMPWSFAIDWFLPVGDWIATWDATLGLNFRAGSVTSHERTNVLTQETQSNVLYSDRYYSQDISSSATIIETRRTPLFSFPMVAMPSFKNPLSVGHCLNALALLRQLTKK